jgi:allantoicase
VSAPDGVSFSGLVDLAAAEMGGRVLGVSDDFFAEAGNLILPGRGVFIDGKFTDRGKWMDGWESRRRRDNSLQNPQTGSEPPAIDHDWCVLALGTPGEVVAFDVDTNHFLGNHPPFASIDGLLAPEATALDQLASHTWTELLPQAALRPGAQNLFVAAPRGPVSHVRLNIFPDGGVARLRVYGRVAPVAGGAAATNDHRDAETRRHVPAGLIDLAAARNGGLALACSDAFFGPMNNLIMPGRPENMGGGWETRRRRGPGHDWIIVQLGARGVPQEGEVDTAHFKGNYPDSFSLDALDAVGATGARPTDLIASARWSPLLPRTKLGPDARHFFPVASGAAATHVRLNIFPDGGVSRLRIWGRAP